MANVLPELMDQAIAGNSEALQRLLHLHWRRLEGYLREHFPDALQGIFEPRDILQDVYQLAFRGIQTFKPQGDDAVFRWLLTIARNRMTELVRAQMTVKRGGIMRQDLGDGGDDNVASLLEQLAVSYRTPSTSAVRHELAQAMEKSLEQLLPAYRDALRLHYFEGLSIEEVGRRMNRSKGSAQMLCNRGLKQLKKSLISISRYS